MLYPGRPGTSAGPDFRDAVLEVEGLGLVQGDVELHLRQQDWYNHGHHGDPNYNGVVLHAALETVPQTTNLFNGQRAPTISLASLLDEALTPALSQGEREEEENQGLWELLERKGWRRPADAAGMGQLLDTAGDDRFRAKSAVFAALNREQPPSQTLYEGLMEGLGYRANRQPFLKLAQAAPWQVLAREAAAQPPELWAAAIENRLLQVAGLAEPRAGKRTRHGGYGRSLRAEEWHTFRVRPANHPRHRMAGAARLLARCLEPGAGVGADVGTDAGADEPANPEDQLAAALGGLVAEGGAARLTGFLTVKADGGQGSAYVGAQRARDLAVNVVLPFCHSRSQVADAVGETAALSLYKKFPKLQANEITREMAEQLLPAEWDGVANSARRQQGLIHLHRQLG